jgi:hypothetical protein
MIIRLMGALFALTYPKFYSGRHRARARFRSDPVQALPMRALPQQALPRQALPQQARPQHGVELIGTPSAMG